MTSPVLTPVGRLAPSPTGLLHVGHARTFLVAWWSARKAGGRLLLRFEDLDTARSRSEFEAEARIDLAWLGIDWDGTETRQSEHRERIVAAATALEQQQRAYACVCSRGDLRNVVSAPHVGEARDVYQGTCRGLFASRAAAEATSGRQAGLRYLTPNTEQQFDDLILGPVRQRADTDGDFLILRRDGTPAYQLAVVVDDAASGVTQVVRGADLLDSTARQLALIDALGYPVPSYAHVPLVFDQGGVRIAKRADGLSIRQLRDAGVQSQRLVSWAARSLGLLDSDVASAAEVLSHFDFGRIRPDATRVDRRDFGL